MTQEEKIAIADSAIRKFFGMTVEELKTVSRKREYAEARHVWWWMVRAGTGLSFSNIAKRFNRNHATVLHGIRCLNDMIFSSHSFCARMEKICLYAEERGWGDPSKAFLRMPVSHGYEFPRDMGRDREGVYISDNLIPTEHLLSIPLTSLKFQTL